MDLDVLLRIWIGGFEMSKEREITDADAAVKAAEKPARLAGDELELAKKSLARANDALTSAQGAMAAAEAEQKKCEAAVPAAKKAAGDSAMLVKTVAFSADGLVLATAGDDRLVQTWSAENGVAMEEFRATTAISALALAGGSIIAGGEKSITSWPTKIEWILDRKLPLAGQPPILDCINALDFSGDGKLLAACDDRQVHFWTIADGKPAGSIPASAMLGRSTDRLGRRRPGRRCGRAQRGDRHSQAQAAPSAADFLLAGAGRSRFARGRGSPWRSRHRRGGLQRQEPR